MSNPIILEGTKQAIPIVCMCPNIPCFRDKSNVYKNCGKVVDNLQSALKQKITYKNVFLEINLRILILNTF